MKKKGFETRFGLIGGKGGSAKRNGLKDPIATAVKVAMMKINRGYTYDIDSEDEVEESEEEDEEFEEEEEEIEESAPESEESSPYETRTTRTRKGGVGKGLTKYQQDTYLFLVNEVFVKNARAK
eukprot:UN30917